MKIIQIAKEYLLRFIDTYPIDFFKSTLLIVMSCCLLGIVLIAIFKKSAGQLHATKTN